MSSLWSGTNVSSRNVIALRFDHLPLQNWGLSSRTLNALLRHNFKMTIGDVIRADETFTTIRGLGTAGFEELDAKASQLFVTLHDEDDAQKSTAENGSSVLINAHAHTGSFIKVLHESVQKLPLSQLHLDVKTHNTLIEAGITTIGELYNASNSCIGEIHGFHSNSLGVVNTALITMLNSLIQDGIVNWFQYWKEQGIQVLLTTYSPSTSSERVVQDLALIIQEVLRRELDERAGIIIKRRFGLGNVAKLTLGDIGNAFGGLSRERIRQIEEKALRILQDVFFEQRYAGKNFHVHPTIHLLIQTIREMLEAEPSKLILETSLLEHVRQIFNIDSEKVKTSLLLVFRLLDLERIDFDYSDAVPAWGHVEPVQRKILESGVKGLDDLLTRETSFPHVEFDILVHLNRNARKSEKLTLTQLSWLINLCNSVERRGDGSIWGKFEYLKGRGNQVERLLVESGLPMSVVDLAREINHRLVPLGHRQVTDQNLVNQVIEDDRFVPIGRSGTWGLKSWTHIDTKNVLTLMEHYLITQNKPATADDIYIYVSERRPVSKNSIIIYLTSERELFAKVSLTTWGLAKWSANTDSDAWNAEHIADYVANVFRESKAKELDYKFIKKAVMEKTGVSAKQAEAFLRISPVIRTRKGNKWDELLAVFQPDYKIKLAQTKMHRSQKTISLRQQVEEHVHNLLSEAPDKRMPMAELVRQLQKQFDRPESTLYIYLGKMDSIERIDMPDSQKKVCRLKEMKGIISKGTLRERVSRSVQVILEGMPGKQMSMADLMKRLQKEYSCPKPTLYHYIAELDYMERLNVPHSNAKLCRMKDTKDKEAFPQAYSIATDDLKQSVIRAISMLNETEVDLGLFSLSRDFENTLKAYLIAADANGKFQIPTKEPPDKWRLANMIDWARKDGIITDSAALNYLRHERNNRAHGGMPPLTERQNMMKSIQYPAGCILTTSSYWMISCRICKS